MDRFIKIIHLRPIQNGTHLLSLFFASLRKRISKSVKYGKSAENKGYICAQTRRMKVTHQS